MTKPGRKSTAELSVIASLENRLPPPPPPELTPKEARIWRDTFATLAHDWITRAAFPIAIALCRHTVRLQKLDALIEKAWGDEDRLSKLLNMAQRELNAMTACARTLRLTPQSLIHPKRHMKTVSDRPRPWEDREEQVGP
jgi:hypothetical protein